MFSPIRSVVVSTTLLLLIAPLTSNAAYTTFARAETSLDQIPGSGFVPNDLEEAANTGSSSFANATTIDQQLDSGRPSGVLYRRQSLGEASASAGVLKAVATAGFFADGYQTGSFIDARSTASFSDVLTVFRPGARQATVQVTYAVSGSLFGSPNFVNASGQLDVGNSPVINFTNSTSLGAGAYTCSNGGAASPCFGIVELTLPTNTQISLRGSLSVFARASGQLNRGNSSAQYGNTGLVYLSSADPEVQLFTQSGYTYLAPVPEAHSWCLLLAGLASLGVVTRYRRNRA